MKTIECVTTVDSGHRLTLQLPEDIAPGEHRIRLTIVETALDNQADAPQGMPAAPFPTYDLGPWPEGFTVSREQIKERFDRRGKHECEV